MKPTKQENDIIMKFITHYDLQNDTNKKILRVAFLEESGLTQNTFYYKLSHKNYKRQEIKILAELLAKSKKAKKNDTTKML